MRNFKRNVEVEVHPDSHELAEVFWTMDAEEQAGFFNHLSSISGGALPMQLQYLTDSEYLEDAGRYVMHALGVYSERNSAKPKDDTK